jgi:hypothetical protein
MRYSVARVNQWQPAIAWYHARGDAQARLFVTKSSIRRTESVAVLVQSSLRLAPRVEWTASVAAGDRIFDLAAFGVQQEVASSWMARSALRVWVTPRTALEAGFGQAHESPAFSMRTLSIGVRKALP